MLTELLGRPIAHRGLFDPTTGIPENSVSAVRAALDAGLGVEIDVQASRDGVAFVHHDTTMRRTCGRSCSVSDLDAAEVAATWLSGSTETVPTLREVLAFVGGRVPVLIDLKPAWWQLSGRALLVDAVVTALRGYRGPVCAVSFDPMVLRMMADRAPAVMRGQSAGATATGRLLGPLNALIGAMEPRVTIGVSRPQLLSFNVSRVGEAGAGRWRAAGWPLLGWTVRSVAALHAVRRQVDNVIVEGLAARHLTDPGVCGACESRALPVPAPG